MAKKKIDIIERYPFLRKLPIIAGLGTVGTVIVILGFILFILIISVEVETVGAEVVITGAHRGNSIRFIENTLPAFEDAVNNSKYKFIEFDVQYTKDKTIIVHHDATLFRLQGIEENIPDLTYEKLLNISKYHIPTYEEVMEIVAEKKPVNIEIKSQGNLVDDVLMSDFIVEDIKRREILETTLISSPSSEAIEYIKRKYPEVSTGKVYYVAASTFLRTESFTSKLFEEMERINADYLMLHGSNLRNYELLKDLKPINKTLVFWFFDDEMHIVEPKPESKVLRFRFFKPKEIPLPPKECIWWC
jgi:glycerophosphoryl diester phosphodiesterase